jgi:two-component system LytT family sensor kinase
MTFPERNTAMRQAAWLLCIWALITAAFIGQVRINYEMTRHGFQLGRSIEFEISYHAAWLVWIPGVYLLARRVTFGHTGRAWQVLVLALAGIAFAALQSGLTVTFQWLMTPSGHGGSLFALVTNRNTYIGSLATHYWLYCVTLGFCYAVLHYRRMQERAARAERLAGQLTTARLGALQAQMQPHFLFNALNAASALAPVDAQAAQLLLVQLGDLLRYSMDVSGRLQVPLSEEIDFLERYLAIERTRFGDRLQVRFTVDETALDAPVPSLILQPVVENAIRYAVAPRAGGGRVAVSARDVEGSLVLEVSDDGPGMPPGQPATGRGLANVRSRLETAFGPGPWLGVGANPSGGTLVTMRIPRQFVVATETG